uniref:Bridge-like lipid transfer protein family member 1 C-terminal domain-containing protein n=1 Tax=Timema bartmani TaxID=61472 RepID=A0A7R9F2Z8_9NEOP|nr:unnamed protein product [Timema bartmani]
MYLAYQDGDVREADKTKVVFKISFRPTYECEESNYEFCSTLLTRVATAPGKAEEPEKYRGIFVYEKNRENIISHFKHQQYNPTGVIQLVCGIEPWKTQRLTASDERSWMQHEPEWLIGKAKGPGINFCVQNQQGPYMIGMTINKDTISSEDQLDSMKFLKCYSVRNQQWPYMIERSINKKMVVSNEEVDSKESLNTSDAIGCMHTVATAFASHQFRQHDCCKETDSCYSVRNQQWPYMIERSINKKMVVSNEEVDSKESLNRYGHHEKKGGGGGLHNSYTKVGHGQHCAGLLVKEGFGNQINLYRNRGLNPGPPAQKSDTLPLDHQFLDNALSDRFVCGVTSVPIQKRLLSEHALDLKQSVKIENGMELANNQTKILSSNMERTSKPDTPSPSDQNSGSSWETLVLFAVNFTKLNVHMNMGNVMGNVMGTRDMSAGSQVEGCTEEDQEEVQIYQETHILFKMKPRRKECLHIVF